jgi:hypothetical protein
MENTPKPFINNCKNTFSIGLWDLFNTTGITTTRVFNHDKLTTTHIIDLRTSYRFPETFPLRIETACILYSIKTIVN